MTTYSKPHGADADAPFELKGSLFTMTVLLLRQTELDAIDQHLIEKINQAPAFFQNVPVVIDLIYAPATSDIDFKGLYQLLCQRGMIPVAVRNGSDAAQQVAIAAGLPILPEARAPLATQPLEPKPEPSPAPEPEPSTEPPSRGYRMLTQPVRSGQQIYAPGDLILLGPVSPGAEVLADGNIHIYAPLRGRALAGAKGDVDARIFCQILEAQLVSIAGTYRVIEKLGDQLWGKSAQIYLSEEERLIIEPLSR